MTNSITDKARELTVYLETVKRHLHSNPELGLKEYKTTAFVKKELLQMGVEVVPLETEVGVLGIIRGEKAGPSVVTALRADMDAMPIQEKTDLPDISTVPGVMHACGHDCHTSMLLGAARLLVSMKEDFSGTVKLIFQPAEEVLVGSSIMIDAGVLENPKVDSIIALHGSSDYEAGKVAFSNGHHMASSDFFTVKVLGIGGHGAYPHKTPSDVILASSNAIIALQSIVTRQINATDNVVLSVCTVNGGEAKNVIPSEVIFSGSIRCQDSVNRNSMEERMNKVISNVVAAYGCTHEMDYHYGVPPLTNDKEVAERFSHVATEVVGSENVQLISTPVMGSEDFSRYLEKVPGLFVRLGVNIPGKPKTHFHSEGFVFPEENLPIGVALLTQYVLSCNN